MLLVPSRRFGCPSVQYSNEAVSDKSFWNLIGKNFYRHEMKNLKTLVLVDNTVDREKLNKGLAGFQTFCRRNYEVANINFVGEETLDNPKSTSDMKTAIQRYTTDLVLLILQSRDVEAYSRFKDLMDRTFGYHSICMTERVFEGKMGSSMGSIMMKVNLKGAGSNHTIQGGKLKNIMADTLVLGADVTHPSGSSILGCPLIAAIVGSVDNHAGRFLGSMRLQSAGKKEVSTFTSNFFLSADSCR